VALSAAVQPAQSSVTLSWVAAPGARYQVEYSTNLLNWDIVTTGEVAATGTSESWTDIGPPGTATPPLSDTARFYRVFQYGSP
jgi:hypothetical protein